MPAIRRSFLPVLALLAGSWAPSTLAARQDGAFDRDRLFLADSTIFVPFLVDSTQPLQEALRQRLVDRDTRLLVLDHPAGHLALLTNQLAYHHVAQGTLHGEPWMVSF